jgi:hypothetical protein
VSNLTRTILFHVVRNFPGTIQEIYEKANVAALRKVFSYNQGQLANYIFVSSRKHKQLKYEIRQVQAVLAANPRAVPNLDNLANLVKSLSLYLDSEFRTVAGQNFAYIKDFFRYKSFKKLPRVSVRAIQANSIVTLARDRWLLPTEEEYPLEANTAFVEIESSGDYYLCNDIPRAVKKGSYENARIYSNEVRNHYPLPNLIQSLKFKMTDARDVRWQRCWSRIQPTGELPPIETCYKSTLVIPMNLLNNGGGLSDEFRSHFGIQANRQFVNFGFLCIDSQIANFFEDDDVHLGYVFSDVFLVYQIQRLSCTTYSRSFAEASSILERYGVNIYY